MTKYKTVSESQLKVEMSFSSRSRFDGQRFESKRQLSTECHLPPHLPHVTSLPGWAKRLSVQSLARDSHVCGREQRKLPPKGKSPEISQAKEP